MLRPNVGSLKTARLLFEASPRASAMVLSVPLAVAFCGILKLLALGSILNSLVEMETGLRSILRPGALLFAAWTIQGMAEQVLPVIERTLEQRLDVRVEQSLISHGQGLSLAVLEGPATRHLFDSAEGGSPGLHPRLAVNGALGLVSWAATIALSTIVLITFAWWAPIPPLIAMVVQFRWFNRLWEGNNRRLSAPSEDLRKGAYSFEIAASPAFAKELRLFGLSGWALDRLDQLWKAGFEGVWRDRRELNRSAALSISLTTAAQTLIIVLVASAGVRGKISPGGVLVYIQTCVALAGTAGTALRNWRVSEPAVEALSKIEIMTEANKATGPPAQRVQRVEEGIVLRGATFSYRGTAARRAIESVDLKIPLGTSAAVVGRNGAGKSTLIKILAGLYEPESGCRQASSDPVIVPQSVPRYPVSLRDNLTLSLPLSNAGQDELDEALGMVGLLDLPSQLPQGWDTSLDEKGGGVGLSGGQWQRLGIARGLLAARNGRPLILDEPTASLDAKVESALVRNLMHYRRGMTTVTISHRFATVRWADRIFVLEQGRVAEAGTHEELLERNGIYAQMFMLQAAAYVP